MPFLTLSAMAHPASTTLISAAEAPSQPPEQCWEEPHPGQRISDSTNPTTSSWGQKYAGAGATEGIRNGMTAKGLLHDRRAHRYRIQRPFLVRRNVRLRRHARAPARRLGQYDAKNGSSSFSVVDIEPSPDILTGAHPRDPIGGGEASTVTDADTEVEVATMVTDQTLVPLSNQSSRCTLGDVSNLLGTCEAGDYQPVTALNPGGLHIGPCEDVYGWEAELGRKMSAREQKTDMPGFHTLASSVRRRNEGAKKFIHRVFSASSGISDLSRGRRASTAN